MEDGVHESHLPVPSPHVACEGRTFRIEPRGRVHQFHELDVFFWRFSFVGRKRGPDFQAPTDSRRKTAPLMPGLTSRHLETM